MNKKRKKELVADLTLSKLHKALDQVYDTIAVYENHPWVIQEYAGYFYDALEELKRKTDFLYKVAEANITNIEDDFGGVL